jgi:OPA family glycerol-3-phosphate transporter-like MFS transporter
VWWSSHVFSRSKVDHLRGESVTRRAKQIRILILLMVGYTGYYLCRSSLSVAAPLIQADLAAGHGGGAAAMDWAKQQIGWIASLGTLVYAIGKLFSGALADLFGGRRVYLTSMAGAVVFTFAFALGGPVMFLASVWMANQLLQSGGWPSIIKISSGWFSQSRFASAVAILSLSWLAGDALVRWLLGLYIAAASPTWQSVFVLAAAGLGLIFLMSLWLVRDAPRDEEDHELGSHDHKQQIKGVAKGLLKNPVFWMVCGLAFVFTMGREALLTWTPLMLVERHGLADGKAGQFSALFPLAGAVAVLALGFTAVRIGRTGRAAVMTIGLAASGALFFVLARPTVTADTALLLIPLIGAVLIGPFSYLTGVAAQDFGGKSGGATAAGLLEGIGYFGGVAAGQGMAVLSVRFGWSTAFQVVGVAAFAAAAMGAAYWGVEFRAKQADSKVP